MPPHFSDGRDVEVVSEMLRLAQRRGLGVHRVRRGADVRVLGDGWTVVTVDGSLSAQFEHTVLVTRDGCEVLTLPEPE